MRENTDNAHEKTSLLAEQTSSTSKQKNTNTNTRLTGNTSVGTSFNFYNEVRLLLNIALPTVILQFCTYIIYPQCASAVGRNLGTEALGAFSLGSLSGNLTCISLVIGTLSASETLQPRAFGLNLYREVGVLAIRGLLMCFFTLFFPMLLLYTRANDVFDRLGQDMEASYLAGAWIKVYVFSVPSLVIFRVIQRYLACQNIVLPCTFGAAIGSFCIHPFVVKWAIQKFGFLGSSWAIVITQTIQCFFCISFVAFSGSFHKETWPGLSTTLVSDALDINKLMAFAKLSIGGCFSLSEWWFWESICFIAGKFGLVDLCIHTVTYQLIPFIFMIPLGISIGLSVRMGILLPVDVSGAKRLAALTMISTTVVGILVSCFIYKHQLWIVSLFTLDEAILEGCEKIWMDLCFYNVQLWIFGVSRGILSALGLQWRTALTMIAVLWCGAIPAIIHWCIQNNGGFLLMWKMIPYIYAILDVGLICCFAMADWESIGESIRIDNKINDAKVMEI